MSPPGSSIVRVVVTDTNILINLIHIGRLDLLGKLPSYSFVVPEEVVREVREPQQAQSLQTAMSSGLLVEVQLADPAELKVYADLIQISKQVRLERWLSFRWRRAGAGFREHAAGP